MSGTMYVIIALALVIVVLLAVLYFSFRKPVLAWVHSRHEPWYADLLKASKLTGKHFKERHGHTYFWSDAGIQVKYQRPPDGEGNLIVTFKNEHGATEHLMLRSDKADGESHYFSATYGARPLTHFMRRRLQRMKYEIDYQIRHFLHGHHVHA